LHDAVTNPPAGTDESDVDDLIDAAKGSKPARGTPDGGSVARDPLERVGGGTVRAQVREAVLTSKPAEDGLVESTLVLPELEHRQVMNAINAAAGAPCDDERTPAQRMADG
jgi:hypothetical protein